MTLCFVEKVDQSSDDKTILWKYLSSILNSESNFVKWFVINEMNEHNTEKKMFGF